MRASLTFIAVLAALLAATVAPAAVTAQSSTTVWAHYPFDTSVNADTSGQGNNAIVVGTGPLLDNQQQAHRRFGQGSAYSNNYNYSTSSNYLQMLWNRGGSGSFTVSFWLYPLLPTYPASGNFVFGSSQHGLDTEFALVEQNYLVYKLGSVSYQFCLKATWNVWSHFAAVVVGPNLYLYVNGTLCNGNQPSGGPTTGTRPYSALTTYGYYMDELWLINSAIQPSKVMQLYTDNSPY